MDVAKLVILTQLDDAVEEVLLTYTAVEGLMGILYGWCVVDVGMWIR